MTGLVKKGRATGNVDATTISPETGGTSKGVTSWACMRVFTLYQSTRLRQIGGKQGNIEVAPSTWVSLVFSRSPQLQRRLHLPVVEAPAGHLPHLRQEEHHRELHHLRACMCSPCIIAHRAQTDRGQAGQHRSYPLRLGLSWKRRPATSHSFFYLLE